MSDSLLRGDTTRRILRGLVHRGWVESGDLYLCLGVVGTDPEHSAVGHGLARLAKRGLLERRAAPTYCEYRLTTNGRREFLRVDTRTIFAPARPGTEHLLCL